MTAFSLDDIRAAAEAKYGSTDIDLGGENIVRLLNPLRLAKAARARLVAIQDELGEDDADQEALLSEALVLVAETPGKGKALLKAVGDDLAVLASLFERYSEGTQAGEASASQS
ncbi:phage tail assembly protein [Streptomyces sp. NBC_01198]|uniref:phage tail assembly protein n=1 Tax=Streptomyces sp. NBC_01198 TaxID=2903769 RepID=UPI002E14A9BC|nr:phage tail assembly protein [Streptomyces sp. NBC_01198]